MPVQSFRTSNAIKIPRLLFLSKYNHFENLKRPNFRMDAPGFEPSTLSIGIMIDWHINPLSHHGSVTLDIFNILRKIVLKLVNFFSAHQSKPNFNFWTILKVSSWPSKMFFYTYDNLLLVDVYYLKIETSIIKIFDIYVAIIAQILILRGEQKYCFFPKVEGQRISFQFLKLPDTSINHYAQFVFKKLLQNILVLKCSLHNISWFAPLWAPPRRSGYVVAFLNHDPSQVWIPQGCVE